MLKIEEIEKAIKDGNNLQIRAEERKKSLLNEYNKTKTELKELGINDPKTAVDDLNKLKAEIEHKVKEIETLLPIDVIEKYKSYDFSADVEEVPDVEGQPF